jgi:hypothetical protein
LHWLLLLSLSSFSPYASLPFEFLSNEELAFAKTLDLPVFEGEGMTLLKRLTLMGEGDILLRKAQRTPDVRGERYKTNPCDMEVLLARSAGLETATF